MTGSARPFFWDWFRLTFRPKPCANSVLDVALAGCEFKVLYSIVAFLTVQVVHIKTVWITDERASDKPVNTNTGPFRIHAEVDVGIAVDDELS